MLVRVFCLICGCALLAGPSPAQAQRRVSVQSFTGPQSNSLRMGLIRGLSDAPDVVVVSRDELDQVAASVGIHGRLSPSDYATVGPAAQIAAFIRGSVRRRRGRWSLILTVYSGSDGSRLGAVSFQGRTLGSLSAVRRSGYRRLSPLLDQAQPPAPVAQPTPTPAPNAQPWYQRQAPPEIPPEPEEPDEPSAPPGRWRALRVGVLVGTLRRSMHTTALVDPALRGGSSGDPLLEEARSYGSAGLGAMELGVSLELYPGSFVADADFPYLGLLFSYRHSVGLTTNAPACVGNARCPVPAPADGQVSVGTTESELFAGVRVRYGADERTTIYADLGYGLFTFALAEEDLAQLVGGSIVPTMAYSHLRVGAGFRYDAVPRLFTLGAHFDYLAGLGVGDQAKAVWGTETGRPGGFELGLDLESELYPAVDGLFVRLSLSYFRFKTTFRGQTACRDSGGGACDFNGLWEPWPTDAAMNLTGGLQDPVKDGYLRLGLTLGYEY